MSTRSASIVLAFFVLASAADAADLTGHWTGHWADSKSGHTGPLRATFRKCDEAHYRVTFAGRFFKVFPFRYQVELTVIGQDEDRLFLAGEQNLGPLFGTFTYTAEATATDFTAHFCSRRYQGEFVLMKCHP